MVKSKNLTRTTRGLSLQGCTN